MPVTVMPEVSSMRILQEESREAAMARLSQSSSLSEPLRRE